MNDIKTLPDLIYDAQEYDVRYVAAFGERTLAGQLADALAASEAQVKGTALEASMYRERAITAEAQVKQLQEALSEARGWVLNDLADEPIGYYPEAVALLEQIDGALAAGAGEQTQVLRCPECGDSLTLGHDCLAGAGEQT